MARLRARNYDEKQASILDQAAKLFARQGFSATSVAELSRECKASKAWIYHYYDSKEAILFEILDRHIRCLVETLERAPVAGRTPAEKLGTLVERLLQVYEDADATHRILLTDLHILPDHQQASIRSLERRIVRRFADAVLEACPTLARHPARVKPLTMSLLGMLNWHFTWYRRDGALSRKDYAKLAAELFLNGLGSAAVLKTGGCSGGHKE